MYVNGYDVRGISLELESDFEVKRAIYSSTDRIFPSISFVFAKRRVITRFEQFEYLPLETSLSLYTLSIAHFFERVRKLKGAGEWWRGERTLERASVRQAHVALINNAIIRRGASSVTLFGS